MSEEEKNEKSKVRGLMKEHYSFVIALIVVIPFMIFFGVVLLVFKDAALLEKMTALLSGLVAAVIGYYFGQRPVQELSNQVKTAQQEKHNKEAQSPHPNTQNWGQTFSLNVVLLMMSEGTTLPQAVKNI